MLLILVHTFRDVLLYIYIEHIRISQVDEYMEQ